VSGTIPAPGEALVNQGAADRAPCPRHGTKLAAILVLVAQASGQRELAAIEQHQQPCFRGLALDPFRLAPRRAEFRGVDIRDADFLALEPEGIAIDDAVHMMIAAAERKRAR
jgi:hypothetical protein